MTSFHKLPKANILHISITKNRCGTAMTGITRKGSEFDLGIPLLYIQLS